MRNETALRVLVASDHSVIREGIVHLLKGTKGLELISESLRPNGAGETADVILCVVEPRPDLPLLLRHLREAYADAKLLCLFLSQDEAIAIEALRAGALGVIDETFRTQNLVEAIQQVAQGEMVISNQMARRMAKRIALASERRPAEEEWELTPREREVLRMLAEGNTNRDMAAKLSLSEHTIRAHLRGIMQKLHVTNRVQAAALAWQHHLTESVVGERGQRIGNTGR
jgi:two-component system NarL family response regulator